MSVCKQNVITEQRQTYLWALYDSMVCCNWGSSSLFRKMHATIHVVVYHACTGKDSAAMAPQRKTGGLILCQWKWKWAKAKRTNWMLNLENRTVEISIIWKPQLHYQRLRRSTERFDDCKWQHFDIWLVTQICNAIIPFSGAIPFWHFLFTFWGVKIAFAHPNICWYGMHAISMWYLWVQKTVSHCRCTRRNDTFRRISMDKPLMMISNCFCFICRRANEMRANLEH